MVILPKNQQGRFGILKKVSLRTLWPHEALDFTPWLAKNLDVLSEKLGMDLELQLQEAPVGTFSLDLLAHDLGTDRTVVIENQIEQTDHDHLGKLITYAAGHNASVAVWIAASFREEHRQALDWLNQRADTSTEYFGVVLEAIQIDDSRPACNFRLVSFPNDWRKHAISTGTSKPSARGESYRIFFQGLIDNLREKHAFTQARKAQAQSWYTFTSGIRGASFGFSFAMGGRARVEIYIDREDADWNKWLFDALIQQRVDIESNLDALLSWERLDDKRASRIACYRDASIEDSHASLVELEAWAIQQLLNFRKVFKPKISALIESAPSRVIDDSHDAT